jgi:hypothetical protein
MAGDKRILAIAQKRAADGNPRPNAPYGVGITASVIDLTMLADGVIRLTVKGLERVAVLRLAEGEFLAADIGPIEETRGQEAEAFSLMRAVLDKLESQRSPSVAAPFRPSHIREPRLLADAIASRLSIDIERGKTSWRPMMWSCVWKRSLHLDFDGKQPTSSLASCRRANARSFGVPAKTATQFCADRGSRSARTAWLRMLREKKFARCPFYE